ncbi:cytochrome P450 monooxygenase pc-2 [Rickenella mellea]|uniref:Cytochrome P450 monooxygenase pc-2 n=1 Tax=Rickenella mellea TaxID=50990 RepID=A0A4Y7QHF7_9AGAM|nr:cytochrome P450 monooxygenase pc-2 [Rickenella mellea]
MPPPGVLFLLGVLPPISLAAIAVYVTTHLLRSYFEIYVPAAVSILTFLLLYPSYKAAAIAWDVHSQKREAAAMGAVEVPLWEAKWPGGLDLLLLIAKKIENGYPGEVFNWPLQHVGQIFRFRAFWVNQIFTSDPEHMKTILAIDFNKFEKGKWFTETLSAMLGTGVLNSDGEMWKFHRTMTRPFFTRDRTSHFDIFERHSDEAILQMTTRLNEDCAIDFQDVIWRFTLDSATEFLFGSCVHSLSDGLPYPHFHPKSKSASSDNDNRSLSFASALEEAMYVVSRRARIGPIWPLLEIFNDKSRRSMKVIERFLDPIIRHALERKRLMVGDGEGREKSGEIGDDETLLDHLVKSTEDMSILKDEVINMMIAGRDTTATTLTYAFYFLALHPHVLERLRGEILANVGHSRRPTFDDIREMKYLRAVINETLRLFPPVPFNLRTSINATTLPALKPGAKPFYIPALTNVTYSVFTMHRRTDLWGPDAQEFDPDRFIDSRLNKYLTPNPAIFQPFSIGPRICLGQQFAYNEASFMLVRLLQRFDGITLDSAAQPPDSRPPPEWVLAEGRQAKEQVWPKSHITMYSHKGLWLRLRAASRENEP